MEDDKYRTSSENKNVDIANRTCVEFKSSPDSHQGTSDDSRNDRNVVKRSNQRSVSKKRSHSCSFVTIRPMYKNYQLLGDSQLVRFSSQILNMNKFISFTSDTKSRRIGYCVGGQKIDDLRKRLVQKEFDIHDNIIMLIGTNDLLYNTPYDDMCISYNKIMEILTHVCKKIVILTVPPVPRIASDLNHLEHLMTFNKFLEEKADDDKVTVVDLCSLFIGFDNTINNDYYEKFFSNSSRSDMIHLNIKGFKMLQSLLDIQYFENLS